jgi:hypothetical protein
MNSFPYVSRKEQTHSLLLTSGGVFAQQLQFSDFDTNADKNLSIEEYGTGLDQTKLYVM